MLTVMKKREQQLVRVMRYAAAVMAAVYIVLGLTVFFRAAQVFALSTGYAQVLGLLFLSYGAFRGYRVVMQFTRKSNTDE